MENTAVGTVKSVNVSVAKGGPKRPAGAGSLVPGLGIEGDAHAGPGPKQISLLAWESTLRMKAAGAEVDRGSFGENITTAGIDLRGVRVGDRLKVGADAVLEVSAVGKECQAPCAIYRKVGSCIMPVEGVFCRVLAGGAVRDGYAIEMMRAPGK